MKAARIHGYGGPSALIVEEVDQPVVGPGEVLVKVAAAAVNPVDWKLREGYLRQQLQLAFPFTLGCDLSGVVAEVGEGVVDWGIGDAVYGYPHLLRCGAFAEYACMLEGELAPAPEGLDLAEAAALPVAGITAWDGLFAHGALQAGEKVLVLGGAGGVGSAAVQMAVAAGAEVWATTSRRNFDFVLELGATPIDYQNQTVTDAVQQVDLLFDSVGIEAGMAALGSLKPGGRYVTSVYALPPAELVREKQWKTAVYGIQPSGQRLRSMNAIVERGALRMRVEREFALSETRQALEASQTGRTRGKLLIRP